MRERSTGFFTPKYFTATACQSKGYEDVNNKTSSLGSEIFNISDFEVDLEIT